MAKSRTRTFNETGVAAVGEGEGRVVMKEMKEEMTKDDAKDNGKKYMKIMKKEKRKRMERKRNDKVMI